MLNILITGAKGFLGRSLKAELLQSASFCVLEFCRDDSDELLKKYLEIADYIFHFAGEVRPNSTDDAFKSSNTELTQKIISSLQENNKNTPIIYASTVHAITPKNTYGFTKRESEKIIEAYSHENEAAVWIYRIPHVFGPGCKPNYNSVISTWIYNSIHNLDIVIYDRSIEMHYCFIQDLIATFNSTLLSQVDSGCAYVTPGNVYDTTLGEVADLLFEFKASLAGTGLNLEKGSFEGKLYITYQSYLDIVHS